MPASNWLTRLPTIAVLSVLVLTSSAGVGSVEPEPWHLAWNDEFNAPAGTPPDPARWSIVTGGSGFGNKESETYTARPENVQQSGGNLVITARHEDYTGADGIPAHYTSARLNTQGHFAQAYGRFEARIKLPVGKGIWPAFWLLGDNDRTAGWPICGEIDILEAIGEPATTYSTLHGPGYSGGRALSSRAILPTGQTLDGGFHLYAVEWKPNDIRFFVDSTLVVARTPADLPADTAWVYDHPFHILLNFAVGGQWPGYPDASTPFPQQMLVDYVRVYMQS